MSSVNSSYQLHVPTTLETQLLDFRRRVWTIKMIEAAGVAGFSVFIAYLTTFVLDRLWDTPVGIRLAVLGAALAGCMIAPYYFHRWIWSHRRLENLARLLSRKMPRIGDQLLGIIELAHSDSEQARSRTLCKAAIEQVAQDAQKRNLNEAAPNSRHWMWSLLSGAAFLVALGLLGVFPSAAGNAWARFIAPWSNTPRYTFTAIKPLDKTIVVAHGEPFTIVAQLNADSRWHPSEGYAKLGDQPGVKASLEDGTYSFEMLPQHETGQVTLSIGDWTQTVDINPVVRPELTGVTANIKLPEYLGRPDPLTNDVRGGSVSVVKGSQAGFAATASRTLQSAQVDGKDSAPKGDTIRTPQEAVDESKQMELTWRDQYGLSGKNPFKISISAHDDEAPSIAVEDLPRMKVVLDSEQLVFKVRTHDDFGVKHVGMVWKGLPSEMVEKPASGETMLGAGGTDKAVLELEGTFTAKKLGIEPQPIELRIFAEDYYPNRARVYSPKYLLYVLDPEQHAKWVFDQLNRWHRQALEVRDRELQLYETNKQLREMSADQLDQPETRKRIETQAAAERMNGNRLNNLSIKGEELLRQAARNPEIAAAHLDSWAEMLQILKDIASNRMPSVADLLKQGAQAPAVAAGNPTTKRTMTAGVSRASGSGSGGKKEEGKAPPPAPTIADTESTQEPMDDKGGDQKTGTKPPSRPKLGLPMTTVMGKPPKNNDANNQNTPAEDKMDQAVQEQKDLLAEFQKIADKLSDLLANLEGSTFVKRLKAASRKQYVVSGKIGDQLNETFGVEVARTSPKPKQVFDELSQQELKHSTDVSTIMDDMQAYFERRQLLAFKTVLEDMRSQDVIGSLRKVSDDIPKERGLSMSQCEYWSDVLDRWAEDLVDPACKGECNCKGGDSLPPAVVLEVLQILEGEINLREDTRVGEQAKAALAADKYLASANKLSETQKGLEDRVAKVIETIRDLPDGEAKFGKEIALLSRVDEVMGEATSILARPDTGKEAIAAETEAIELLLRSKRINPKGGGGGGSTPGHGGGGDTVDTALALVGIGANQKESREDRGVSQAVGKAGSALPEEFRAGLNEYFGRLEGTSEKPEGASRKADTDQQK